MIPSFITFHASIGTFSSCFLVLLLSGLTGAGGRQLRSREIGGAPKYGLCAGAQDHAQAAHCGKLKSAGAARSSLCFVGNESILLIFDG